MASRRENVVVVLLHIANDLDDRGYPMAGVLRQLAREVAQMAVPAVEEGRCCCGQVIVHPWTGRPRKFCHACSPPRGKLPEKVTIPSDRSSEQEGAA